jgi:hypothetical protein
MNRHQVAKWFGTVMQTFLLVQIISVLVIVYLFGSVVLQPFRYVGF